MIPTELAKEHVTREAYVITETEQGFRIYAPSDPKRAYLVSGTPAAPTCTCAEFRRHSTDPTRRCAHILAVLNERSETGHENGADRYEAEERRAIQDEGRSSTRRRRTALAATAPTEHGTTMLLKRSASPDGRIDSLSVEFSCLIDTSAAEAVKDRADRLLAFQSGIIAGFLQTNQASPGNGAVTRREPRGLEQKESAAVPAQLIDVSGMDGKWGRRLFINVNVDGRTVRFFGTRDQLAEALAAAGYDDLASEVEEGMTLDVPCRVTTKPTPDGRYLNVVKVLPRSASDRARKAWS